jgi:Xaa-Pro dipeptidase
MIVDRPNMIASAATGLLSAAGGDDRRRFFFFGRLRSIRSPARAADSSRSDCPEGFRSSNHHPHGASPEGVIMSMDHLRPFPPEELEARLARLRLVMAERGLDAAVVVGPENIYYLTGVDHYGYFFQYYLLVPLEGQPVLICRRMEQVTMDIMLQGVRFHGHLDHERPADYLIEDVKALGLERGRIGLEKQTLFGPLENFEIIFQGLPQVEWRNFSEAVDELRRVKSPLELDYVRRAAAVSVAMTRAAVDACRAGAAENEIAAAACSAMCSQGGAWPGFPPFVRSTPTMGMEHGG